MNRKILAPLPLLALLIGLTGLAQAQETAVEKKEKVEDAVGAVKWLGKKIGRGVSKGAKAYVDSFKDEGDSADDQGTAPPPVQQQLPPQVQPLRPGNPDDSLMSVRDLVQQSNFLNTDRNRINEIFKRAAAEVRARYMLIARPANKMGRLIRLPFCDASTSRGVLFPGSVNNQGVVTIDGNSFPNYQNCIFVFETFDRGDGALDVEHQTALVADIRVKLGFDSFLGARPPSLGRAQGQPVVRWDVELTSEPYVFQGLPNTAPPVPASFRVSASEADLPADLRETPADSVERANYFHGLELARRSIDARDGGIASLGSVVEDRRIVTRTFDPCGETPPLDNIVLIGSPLLFETRCYTYSAKVIAFGNQQADSRYRGQLRLRFQKDSRTGRITGIRAFAFGGSLQ